MKLVRIIFLALPIYPFLLSGCGSLLYEEDRNAIKLAQQASLTNIPGQNKIAGQSIRSYFSRRSVQILPAGWAAALTHDGYYLTAGHAVAHGPPVIYGGRVGFLEGRVVHVFPERDLAILKFPQKPIQHFRTWGTIPDEGEVVFTAGIYGFEPFESKATVTGVGGYSKTSTAWGISSTLPSFPGMSGAPIANGRGDLIGVIRGSWVSRFTGKAHGAEISMLSPSVIKDVIENDRVRRRQD